MAALIDDLLQLLRVTQAEMNLEDADLSAEVTAACGLGNAWKFTSGREDASIEFATTAVDEVSLCCYVRDNGAGFNPDYVGQLFQRLRDASEFPGTGIGPASVRRIIDRHGGRVWAEGAVGYGATIYFTLDANEVC